MAGDIRAAPGAADLHAGAAEVLGDDAGQPHFIQTLPKRGYCFVAAVSECASPKGTHADNVSETAVRQYCGTR